MVIFNSYVSLPEGMLDDDFRYFYDPNFPHIFFVPSLLFKFKKLMVFETCPPSLLIQPL